MRSVLRRSLLYSESNWQGSFHSTHKGFRNVMANSSQVHWCQARNARLDGWKINDNNCFTCSVDERLGIEEIEIPRRFGLATPWPWQKHSTMCNHKSDPEGLGMDCSTPRWMPRIVEVVDRTCPKAAWLFLRLRHLWRRFLSLFSRCTLPLIGSN